MYDVDYLTGLASRRGLYAYYGDLEQSSYLHALFLDLDNFKNVNDVYGHSMGDSLLQSIAEMMKAKVDGFTCRMGGDEFVILIDGQKSEDEVEQIANEIMLGLLTLDFRKDILTRVSFSIGVVLNQQASESLDDILYKCDTAMYQAKKDGKNCTRIFDANARSVQLQKRIELTMEDALANGEFEVYIQPKINIFSAQLCGAEVLSRWNTKDGILYPDDYMPVLESNGYVVQLDYYMFEEMCKIRSSWRNKAYKNIPVAVNMSRLHLYEPDFIDRLLALTDKYGISPSEIDLEFDEIVLLKDSATFAKVVEELKKHHFRITIDNFNAGLNQLTVLKKITVDAIKIAKDFLLESFEDFIGKNILHYSMIICASLKLDTIIVGVSEEEQLEFLMNCGARIAQGEYFSKPLPRDEFEVYADAQSIYESHDYYFKLNGNLLSEDGSIEGEYVGDEPIIYDEGILKGEKSVYFPGGDPMTNLIKLPTSVLKERSFTISMWIKPTDMHLFEASFFVEYVTGFMAMHPLAWEGHCSFRIHNKDMPMSWFDNSGYQFRPNQWAMFTVTYNARTETSIIYENGFAVNKLTEVPMNFNPQNVFIGGDIFQRSFVGNICEVQIYNEVKDERFIQELYKSYIRDERFLKDFRGVNLLWY